jgi:hypothetical protein
MISDEEHEIQKQITQWVDLNIKNFPELEMFHAIPNGGKREKKQAKNGKWYCPTGKKLKEEGVKRGVWDIYILYPNSKYHGLIVETKTSSKSSVLSKYQKEWEKKYIKYRYKTCIVRDLYEFIDCVTEYIKE